MNNTSTLTLSPLSVDDYNITCSVVLAERLGRLDSSDIGLQSKIIDVQSKKCIYYPFSMTNKF